MKNFKSTLILFAIVFFSYNAMAEGDTKLFGIRAGYQLSDVYKSGTGVGSLHGFYIGGFKNNKIVPALHFGYGLEYFQNGYYLNENYNETIHTLSVPLNLKFKLGPLFILGGVGANFKLSEINEGPGVNDEAPSMDVPLLLGAGLRILILNIEARYHWGMIDVNPQGGRNQYLQVGVGVSF